MTVLRIAAVLLASLGFLGLGVGCTARRNFEPEAPETQSSAPGTTPQVK